MIILLGLWIRRKLLMHRNLLQYTVEKLDSVMDVSSPRDTSSFSSSPKKQTPFFRTCVECAEQFTDELAWNYHHSGHTAKHTFRETQKRATHVDSVCGVKDPTSSSESVPLQEFLILSPYDTLEEAMADETKFHWPAKRSTENDELSQLSQLSAVDEDEIVLEEDPIILPTVDQNEIQSQKMRSTKRLLDSS